MKPQFKREEIYLDLSKLSEEQQRKVIALLPEPINKDDYHISYLHFYLIYDDEDCMWWVSTKYFLAEKTEINYSQFLDMMGETSADISILESTSKNEEVVQVENILKYLANRNNELAEKPCFENVCRMIEINRVTQMIKSNQ